MRLNLKVVSIVHTLCRHSRLFKLDDLSVNSNFGEEKAAQLIVAERSFTGLSIFFSLIALLNISLMCKSVERCCLFSSCFTRG